MNKRNQEIINKCIIHALQAKVITRTEAVEILGELLLGSEEHNPNAPVASPVSTKRTRTNPAKRRRLSATPALNTRGGGCGQSLSLRGGGCGNFGGGCG